MAHEIKYFRVYRNWMQVFEEMSFEQTGRVFSALMSYAFDGDEPEILKTTEERAAFYALAAAIDVAREKHSAK